jgi:hypothetical protein
MDAQVTRSKYEAPKLEVQRLRDLPSALAHSGNASSNSNGQSDTAAKHH